MHCGFLSHSVFTLHIPHVAFDTFIVLLSYLMLVIYISVPVVHFVEGEIIRNMNNTICIFQDESNLFLSQVGRHKQTCSILCCCHNPVFNRMWHFKSANMS